MKNSEESSFHRLLGVWKTTGEVKSGQGNLKIVGVDSYELILDGNYILHKGNVKMGNEHSETLEIMTLDNASDQAKMHYFNSKGEDGMMTGTILGNEFSIEGSGLRFNGLINQGNTTINGKWYLQTENEEWTEFIYINLEKQQ